MRKIGVYGAAITAAALVAAANAAPLDTLVLPPASDPAPLTSNGPLNNAVNRVVTVTSTATGTVARVELTGTLVSSGNGSWSSEARIQVTTPTGSQFIMQPFTATGVFTSVTATAFGVPLGTPVPAAGTWTFRFFESFDDGGTAGIDATWDDGLQIVLDDAGPPPVSTPEPFVDLGTLVPGTPINSVATLDGTSAVKWFKLNVPTAWASNPLSFMVLDSEGSTIADTMLGVYRQNNIGELRSSDDDDGTDFFSQISYGAPGCGNAPAGAAPWNGRDGAIPGGTIWISASPYFSSFANGYATNSTSTATGDINLNITSGTGAPTSAPAVFTDLGTIPNTGTFVTGTATLDANNVRWFRFVTDQAADAALSTYLDIDSETSTLASGNTQIALYDSTGALIGFNNDTGSGALSLLSYGAGLRCPTQTASDVGGFYAGGAARPAGTYFVAVTEFPGTFAANWLVCPNNTGAGGDVTLRVRSGTQVNPGAPSATATDLGTLASTGQFVSTNFVLEQGTVEWFRFTLAEEIAAPCGANRNFLDIDTEGTDASADPVIVLYNQAGTGFQAIDLDSGSGLNAAFSWGSGIRPAEGDGTPYNGRNGALAAGEYYFAVAQGELWGFAINYVACPDEAAPTANAVIRTRLGVAPPAAAPAVVSDLGTIGTALTLPLVVNGTIDNPGEVKWYKFTTAASTDADTLFVDIDNEGSVGITDPELGLYRADGTLRANDDDSGSGFYSQLTFGGNANPRPAVGTGLPYDGRNGTLDAGEYYLVIGAFNTIFGTCDWGVSSTGTATGEYTININTSLPGGGSGGCNVADIVGIGGLPPADGLLTGDDFNAFIGAFAANDLRADIVGIGGLPPADGLITGDDFNAFIGAFAAGCP